MIIHRGGKDEERLYLYDYRTNYYLNDIRICIDIKKTDLPHLLDIKLRHRARYYLVLFFCRVGDRVLDFPCGGGYGSEILRKIPIEYEGFDNDVITIIGNGKVYKKHGKFELMDLQSPQLISESYNVLACIEGIEHIDQQYQSPLIKAFYDALKPGGTLVVTSPEAPDGMSGPSKFNKYHKWELSRLSFTNILGEHFDDVQILRHDDVLHNGQKATCLYGICRKEAK